RVALHNPAGHVLVALPRRIRDDLPAVLLGVDHDLAHGVVVCAVHDAHLRTVAGDGVDARLRGELVHVDHRAQMQGVGRPGHAAPVVAVGRGGEGEVAEFGPRRVGDQLREGDFLLITYAEDRLDDAVD